MYYDPSCNFMFYDISYGNIKIKNKNKEKNIIIN